jgi:hypothetical protein
VDGESEPGSGASWQHRCQVESFTTVKLGAEVPPESA